MKTRKKILVIISAFFCIIISGCAPVEKTTEYRTIYLQDIELFGSINQSHIHLADSTETPSVTFSPIFSYNTKTNLMDNISGHSPVNENGVFQIDTFYNNDGTINHFEKTPGANVNNYEGKNMNWNISSVTIGLDMDVKLFRNFALFGGFNYSSDNNKSLWGANLGLGLFGFTKDELGFRLDAGVHFQNIAYDAYTVEDVRITGPSNNEEYLIFYHDVDQSTHINPFINFTFNTAITDWPVNIFVNLGYSAQTLVDFEPRDKDERYNSTYYHYPYYEDTYIEVVYDQRGESTAGFIHFTPGLHFKFDQWIRLIVGTRFFFEIQLDDATTKTFVLPMLQVDFTL
jgi:hypothetical protein